MFICTECGNPSNPHEQPVVVSTTIRPVRYEVYRKDRREHVLIHISHGHEVVKELEMCVSCSNNGVNFKIEDEPKIVRQVKRRKRRQMRQERMVA